jgi:hypothetical protein
MVLKIQQAFWVTFEAATVVQYVRARPRDYRRFLYGEWLVISESCVLVVQRKCGGRMMEKEERRRDFIPLLRHLP